jgi:hypothetical protein
MGRDSGSARPAAPCSHALTSVMLALVCVLCFHTMRRLRGDGLDHVCTLRVLVGVDVEPYVKSQRQDESNMGHELQNRNPASRAQPKSHTIIP